MDPTPKKIEQNRGGGGGGGGGGLVSQENMNTKKKKKGGWSEKDELKVLKCIIRFEERYGDDDLVDREQVYELILNNIESYASKSALVAKVKELKTKYRENIRKRGPNGEDPAFSNPHDKALFSLSQKAFGTSTSTTSAARTQDDDYATDSGIVKCSNTRKMETTKAVVVEKEKEDAHRMQEEKEKEKEDDHRMQVEKKEETKDDYICWSESDDEVVLKVLDQFNMKCRRRFHRTFTKNKEQRESLGRKWTKLKLAEAKFRRLKAEFDKEVYAHAQETFKSSSLAGPY